MSGAFAVAKVDGAEVAAELSHRSSPRGHDASTHAQHADATRMCDYASRRASPPGADGDTPRTAAVAALRTELTHAAGAIAELQVAVAGLRERPPPALGTEPMLGAEPMLGDVALPPASPASQNPLGPLYADGRHPPAPAGGGGGGDPCLPFGGTPDVDKEPKEEAEQLDHGYRISFRGVSFDAPGQDGAPGRTILDGVSLSLPSAAMCCVMGASGCGKSTLLNIIAGRLAPTRGEVRMRSVGAAALLDALPDEQPIAYVMQDDVVPPCFTVREYIVQQARLRMPEGTPPRELHERVDHIIAQLGLSRCAYQRLGGDGRVSGGERKRVSIAVELLSNPRMLLLDEPTTGLDNASAEAVIAALRDEVVVRQGRTVIAVIHQPSRVLLDTFSHLLLLAQGRVLFSGPPAEALEWFGSIGYPCPVWMNPADHHLQLCEGLVAEAAPAAGGRRDSVAADETFEQMQPLWGTAQGAAASSDADAEAAAAAVRGLLDAWVGRTEAGEEDDDDDSDDDDETLDRIAAELTDQRWRAAGAGAESKAGKREKKKGSKQRGLSDDGLRDALKSIGYLVTRRQAETLAALIDQDGDGLVTRRQIANFLRHQQFLRSQRRRSESMASRAVTVTSWRTALSVLTERCHTAQMRDVAQAKGSLMYGMFMGLVLGVCYWDIGDNAEGVRKRRGLMALICSIAGSIGMQQLSIIHNDRRLVAREEQSRLYKPWVYFVSQCAVSLPATVGAAAAFPFMLYFMSGMRDDLWPFLQLTMLTSMVASSFEGFALFFGALPLRFENARLLSGALVDGLFKVNNGFFVSRVTCQVWLKWLYTVSPLALAYEASIREQYQGRDLDCGTSELACFRNGDDIIRYFQIPEDAFSRCMWICGMWIIIMRVAGTVLYWQLSAHAKAEL